MNYFYQYEALRNPIGRRFRWNGQIVSKIFTVTVFNESEDFIHYVFDNSEHVWKQSYKRFKKHAIAL